MSDVTLVRRVQRLHALAASTAFPAEAAAALAAAARLEAKARRVAARPSSRVLGPDEVAWLRQAEMRAVMHR